MTKWLYDGEIRIQKLKIPPYGTNCYIVACPETNDAIIIDTPAEAQEFCWGARITRPIHCYYAYPSRHLGVFGSKNESRCTRGNTRAEAANLPRPRLTWIMTTTKVRTVSIDGVTHSRPSPGSICLLTASICSSGYAFSREDPVTPVLQCLQTANRKYTQKLLVLPEIPGLPRHAGIQLLKKQKGNLLLLPTARMQPTFAVTCCADC